MQHGNTHMTESPQDRTRVTAPWYFEHRAWVFLTSFVLWLLLVWPFGDGTHGSLVRIPDAAAGLTAALLIALVMRPKNMEPIRAQPTPARCFWFVVYLFALAGHVVMANLDVAYRVLHPAMPLRPGIVRVTTNLRSPAGITMLANSITLTPGTLTVDADEEGILYVHWIHIADTDIQHETERIVSRFERLLSRVFH